MGRGGGGTRLRRGPKAGSRTRPAGRRPRGALGPRENRRARPERAQEAAAQARLGSLIQATFPFPLRQPHAVLAPSRCASSAHPPDRGSPRGRPSPWGPTMLKCKGGQRPLPELPRVESLTVPPVPATLRHYRGPRSSTRRLSVPDWPVGSSIPCEGGGDRRHQ